MLGLLELRLQKTNVRPGLVELLVAAGNLLLQLGLLLLVDRPPLHGVLLFGLEALFEMARRLVLKQHHGVACLGQAALQLLGAGIGRSDHLLRFLELGLLFGEELRLEVAVGVKGLEVIERFAKGLDLDLAAADWIVAVDVIVLNDGGGLLQVGLELGYLPFLGGKIGHGGGQIILEILCLLLVGPLVGGSGRCPHLIDLTFQRTALLHLGIELSLEHIGLPLQVAAELAVHLLLTARRRFGGIARDATGRGLTSGGGRRGGSAAAIAAGAAKLLVLLLEVVQSALCLLETDALLPGLGLEADVGLLHLLHLGFGHEDLGGCELGISIGRSGGRIVIGGGIIGVVVVVDALVVHLDAAATGGTDGRLGPTLARSPAGGVAPAGALGSAAVAVAVGIAGSIAAESIRQRRNNGTGTADAAGRRIGALLEGIAQALELGRGDGIPGVGGGGGT